MFQQISILRRALRVALFVAAIAFAFAVGRRTAPPPPVPPALDWQPFLDQPIQHLREITEAAEQQQPMNYAAANLGFATDAKLYILFGRYVAALPPADRAAAIDTQRRWLSERHRLAEEAYAEYAGGTLASFNGSDAFTKATDARIAEVERLMNATGATTQPGGQGR